MEIASLVVIFICGTFGLHIAESAGKKPITFDDAISSRYAIKSFAGTWISGNEYYITLDDNSVIKYNVDTDETTTLLNQTNYVNLTFTGVTVSADGNWLALQQDVVKVFSYYTTYQYTLIQQSTGMLFPLANGGGVEGVAWAPAGSGLAYITGGDLFYQLESDRLSDTPSLVLNGFTDKNLTGEISEDAQVIWFSPDGKKIVFSTIDISNLGKITLTKFGDPGDVAFQYPHDHISTYDKAGTTNPVIRLYHVDLEMASTSPIEIPAPVDHVSRDYLLGSVSWADDSHFSVTWMNRLQTIGCTQLCPTDEPTNCPTVFSYKEDNGWLTIEDPFWVDSTTFLTVLPIDQGGNLGNFRHLALVNTSTGEVKALTSGESVVTEINCYDPQTRAVFYSSTFNGDSANVLVYKMSLDSMKSECFSCNVDPNCNYGSSIFSHDCANAYLSCKAPGVTRYNIYDKNGQLKKELYNATEIIKELANVLLPTRKDLNVPVPGGFTARVRLLLPPNIDTSGKTKYPLVFNVYSKPDTNQISNAWSTPFWDEYLCGREIIVAFLDGRGCGLRGDKIKFVNYLKLGGPEIEDILVVGKYLQETQPYVDRHRTGIWGYSHGGYVTAMTLAKDYDNIFRCGISVSPVTNWLYYTSLYAERYMGLPTTESNLAGYMDSDVTTRVENFRNKMFYLMHGTYDDNVHYQNSMVLSRALIKANIQFFQQSYPDEDHSLKSSLKHLYLSMNSFWTRCFHTKHGDFRWNEPLVNLTAQTERLGHKADC